MDEAKVAGARKAGRMAGYCRKFYEKRKRYGTTVPNPFGISGSLRGILCVLENKADG
jgi:hypothetical protein